MATHFCMYILKHSFLGWLLCHIESNYLWAFRRTNVRIIFLFTYILVWFLKEVVLFIQAVQKTCTGKHSTLYVMSRTCMVSFIFLKKVEMMVTCMFNFEASKNLLHCENSVPYSNIWYSEIYIDKSDETLA